MKEYFDVLDENGKPAGKTKLRSEVHRDGDWHKSIDIWIINSKDKLLIQKRSAQKESYPNLWEISCSGHVGSGEKSLEAATRELKEELGLEINEKQLQFLFEDREINVTNNGTFINKEFKEIYLLKLDIPLENYKIQPEEVQEIKYVPRSNLELLIKEAPEDFVPHKKLYKKFFEMMLR